MWNLFSVCCEVDIYFQFFFFMWLTDCPGPLFKEFQVVAWVSPTLSLCPLAFFLSMFRRPFLTVPIATSTNGTTTFTNHFHRFIPIFPPWLLLSYLFLTAMLISKVSELLATSQKISLLLCSVLIIFRPLVLEFVIYSWVFRTSLFTFSPLFLTAFGRLVSRKWWFHYNHTQDLKDRPNTHNLTLFLRQVTGRIQMSLKR